MLTVGIDNAAFYVPHYFLDLKTLAQARGIDHNKFHIGLGQHKMSITPPDEGIVTMAANAASQIISTSDKDSITHLLFATESGIDQSKSAGIFVHNLLGLQPNCRIIELKQACYSATAGLQMGLALLRQNPKQKILLIASDIARYGLNTSGESSQGGGAIAMLLTTNPRMIAIEPGSGVYTEDVMDFFRPNYREEALVDGRFSCEMYLKALKETWLMYQNETHRDYDHHDHFCYHIPIPRLAEKAHQKLARINGVRPKEMTTQEQIRLITQYSREIGNCYTASLYMSMISLLDHSNKNLSGQRIGFYSYGSGCSAEYFSGVIQANYQEVSHKEHHQNLLKNREELSQQAYEYFYQFSFPTDGSRIILPKHQTGRYRLKEIDQHKRIYEQVK